MTYTPKPDSLAASALAWLAAHAPAGGEVWLRSSAIAHACGCAIEIVPTRLERSVKTGLVLKRFDKGECEWQHGGVFPEVQPQASEVEQEPRKPFDGTPFRCTLDHTGRGSIQKGHGAVELDEEETLLVAEHFGRMAQNRVGSKRT